MMCFCLMLVNKKAADKNQIPINGFYISNFTNKY